MSKVIFLGYKSNVISSMLLVRSIRSYFRTSKLYSSSTAEEIASIIEDEKRDLKDSSSQKPQKAPFMKNLFLGKFDKEVLTYPEFSTEDRSRYNVMYDIALPVREYMRNEVDSQKIDKDAKIPSSILKDMRELGLFSLQTPIDYGGLGLNVTESSRILEEVSCDASIAEVVVGHNDLAVKVLVNYGTEAQNSKYLPRLSSGEWTAALCIYEPESGYDVGGFVTSAVPDIEASGFSLNGSKTWVTNGSIADLFLVVARYKYSNQGDQDLKKQYSVFIVEKNLNGVSVSPNVDKIGVRGCPSCSVTFTNTFIPNDCMIGKLEDGFGIIMSIFDNHRFSYGPRCAGLLKNLMEPVVEYVSSSSRFGQPMTEFSDITQRLSRMAVDIYAIESMTYLTAGLIDNYQNHDCSLESAILKVFSTETACEHISSCLQILGSDSYLHDFSLDRLSRDIREPLSKVDVCGSDRIFITLLGIQHTGLHIYDDVHVLRNLLMYPKHLFEKVISSFRTSPKMDLRLYEHLHPTLTFSADILESSSKKFASSVRMFLGTQGRESSLPKNQLNLHRLANIAIDLYALTAVLGRASRSYCIGVRNSDNEILIAKQFAMYANRRIESNIEALDQYLNGVDRVAEKIVGPILDNGQYIAQSALTRTHW